MKAPKKPKASASTAVWEKYDAKKSQFDKDKKKKEAIQKKHKA